jgi:hypothetical protein
MDGEPHLTTFDGTRYDLQAAGEFVRVTSTEDDLEVQTRLEPYDTSTSLTVNTAVAAQIDGTRVMFRMGGDGAWLVDDMPVEIETGATFFLSDENAAGIIRRADNIYTLVWPDGSNLHVHDWGVYLDTYFLAAATREGKLMGLTGNADGDPTNDFQTRDGERVDWASDPDALYSEFAEDWRVRDGESLFTYADGESMAGFTDRTIPRQRLTIDDLTPEDRRRAEAACRDAGVTDPHALETCIYDVGFTGDERFIATALALSWKAPAKEDAGVVLSVPEAVTAGAEFDVDWSEFVAARDFITIVPVGAEEGAYLSYVYAEEAARTLSAPAKTGVYEVRYVLGETKETLVSQTIEVTKAQASVEAPDTALAGSRFDVDWSEAINDRDYITIVPMGADEGTYLSYVYAGDAARTLTAPAEPGLYEIRYVLTADKRTLAQTTIEITEPEIALAVPQKVRAGAEIAVAWDGAAPYARDFITIVPVGAEEGAFESYAYAEHGNPATLRAPDTPGLYEVRYILAEGRRTLASTNVEVVSQTAQLDTGGSLDAPDTASPGAVVDVGWQSDQDNDLRIALAAPDAPDFTWIDAQSTQTDRPHRFTMPDAPGIYEFRLLDVSGMKVLSRATIEVR